ncbi:protein of unknown function [Nitrosomonas sp. PY1]|uniref:DUF2914 domain-containing protein n=1 Tax=Nitrosomonas sp. PY1 TaxID=1803906 RepID=UPI001FC7CFA1|nr:DUF2914 domain-containing protein [Nitrosomonas sp. PY1]GKS69230.1 protein of unknown function [Nitrosomonas sp. PY1]
MADNKLKIRIQLQQSSTKVDEPYEETPSSESDFKEQPFDWKKISIAAALVVILLGFMMYLLLSDNESTFNPEQDIVPLVDRVTTSQENQFTANPSDHPANTLTAIPESSSSIKNNSNDDDTSKAPSKIDPITIPIRTKPELTETPKKGTILPARKPHPPNKTSTIVAEDPSNAKTSSSAQVLRAQLTHAIKHREPVDNIESISLNNGESKSVYFYLHLINLQGKAIHIVWYHNNEVDSKLTMQIHSKNWRTYASKHMNQRRLGAWRVELMDDSGSTLTVKNFTVLQS